MNPQAIYLKDYTPCPFEITEVTLHFRITEKETLVESELSMRSLAPNNPPLVLQGEALTLMSIALDGSILDTTQYTLSDKQLMVHEVPETFILKTVVKIFPHQNTSLEGLYASGPMLCTQCEPEGFRKITYFIDRPDVMSRFTTTITAPTSLYPVLLSNGNLIQQTVNEDGTRTVVWRDPFKKPCYLFALVAGDLVYQADEWITVSGRKVALEIYVEPQDIDKVDHAMDSLKRAMRWDEEVYGLEYDLDIYMIVAVSHFNMGAMENKGLNIFNTSCVLAKPETTTDAAFSRVEGVIAHEYFHNWSGNRVTCRDWFQLSLKEGFTVYRDQCFSEDMSSKAVKRIEEVRLLKTHQFSEDAGPLAHPVRPASYIEINNFYTRTVYEKGAEVVRMIATYLGSVGFRLGCDLFFKRHDGQAVTTEDFLRAQADANHKDLSQFQHWYDQAGTPLVVCEDFYDESNERYQITLRQSLPLRQSLSLHNSLSQTGEAHDFQAFLIPVRFALIDPREGEMPLFTLDHSTVAWLSPTLKECVLSFTEKEQSWVFYDVPVRPVPSLFRNFSAPVKVQMVYQPHQLQALMQHDTDALNRWDAMQQLMLQVINQGMDQLKQQALLTISPVLIQAFSGILADLPDDKSFASLLLSLPSEAYIAEQQAQIDVEGIVNALRGIRQVIARELYPVFLKTYQGLQPDLHQPFSASKEAVGRRALRSICLEYLVASESTAALALVHEQVRLATNMTDELSAFRLGVHSHSESLRCELIEGFYQKWQHEPLVMDSWFAIQATNPGSQTLEEVLGLEQHTLFEWTNPNRVRSLVGAFVGQNMAHFHQISGEGYRYLAERVVRLNGVNPQIAARMVVPLTHWRKFDEVRQVEMKKALEMILATPKLSPDVFELASKAFA